VAWASSSAAATQAAAGSSCSAGSSAGAGGCAAEEEEEVAMLAQLRVRQRTASAQSTSSLETSMTGKFPPTKCSIIEETCRAVGANVGGQSCAVGALQVAAECMAALHGRVGPSVVDECRGF